MERDQECPAVEGGNGTASVGLAPDHQWDLLDRADGGAVARRARAIRSLADRVRLVQPLAEGRDMGSASRGATNASGPRRAYRLGPVVCRWEQHPGQSGRRWRRGRRGPEEPPDHALGRSRGGFGSKIHVVTDGRGLPLAAEVTAGQRHESTMFEPLMNAVRIPQPTGRPRCRPARVAGDKRYSYPRIRANANSRSNRSSGM